MRSTDHVCLVGLSGTGKSTVAGPLAKLLGSEPVDLDTEVCRRAGLDVAQLFAEIGEPGFRQMELEALGKALEGPRAVIATGGGIVMTQAAATLLAERATVVWLRAAPEVLLDRLGGPGEERPLLTGDPRGGLEAMAELRDPIYESLADITVDVAELDPQTVADRVASALGVVS